MAELKTPNKNADQLITEHLDIWTTAIEQKSLLGRGSSKKFSLHGIKKLRELILELAVRGKLVPQDPNDEPASSLLERIATEKAQLIKDKKIKKPKAIDNKFVPDYLLPDNWEFAQLDQIAVFTGGFAFKSSQYVGDGTRVIRISDFDERGLKNENIVRYEYEPKLEPFLLAKNDLLMAMTGGTVGKSLLLKDVSEPLLVNQRVAGIRLLSEVEPRYLKYVLQTNLIQSVIEEAKNSTNDNISMGDIRGFLIPLPPTSHQQLLVDKIDELMGLCDALETQTENSIAAHQTLVEVLLEALLKAPEQNATAEQATAQFQQKWQRLSEHFDTLFTTTASIDTLKQTILQLAVMGKLVPQNPNDEPAAKLLERIAAEKAQLIKDKKIKKQKPLPEITDEEKPFELPSGWEWSQCVDTCNPETIITYGILKPVWKEQGVLTARITDMVEGKLKLDGIAKCCHERAAKFEKTTLLTGDLLIAKDGGTLGKTAFVPVELEGGNITQHVLRYAISSELNKYYMRFIIDSPIGQQFMKGETKGVALPGVNVGDFRRMTMGIPPLAEQHRIVSKVDELMAFCDQLKARLTDAQTTKLHLTDAIVEQAL
ncbi:restriction endonuclease subunit S [Pseudoalteromonas sp. APC 3691]|uniref:restriction endonuclease subunit S n=1 Tax=Pseudoalteromonas sp. APC 3691 TaxID=3035173 RepID=UPI0025B3A02A|nr:restriction endonuclease subunit S [Pseudoalteromonas sp. APC 3691]MDN3390156.1 restriction endonuclease subunit S [Pseudoalteromonas sp. APC 3691]